MKMVATSRQAVSTAAIIVVGTELVLGDPRDTNGGMIAQALLAHGVIPESIHIVRDDVEAVAELLRHLTRRVAHIITVGGLGPTIDDVTMEAVASALGCGLIEETPRDAADYSLMSGSETRDTQLRRVPAGAEIIDSGHGPVVHVGNVFSLPGLPRLVSARLPALLKHLHARSVVRESLQLPVRQSRLAQLLEIAAKRHPSVTIGCYLIEGPNGGVRLMFEGLNSDEVAACRLYIESKVGTLGSAV